VVSRGFLFVIGIVNVGCFDYCGVVGWVVIPWVSSVSLSEARLVLGGPQGQGLETAAQVLTSAFAVLGYGVYSTRDYYSKVLGVGIVTFS